MLKVYSMTDYVSVDGKDWAEVGWDGGYCMRDDMPEEVVGFENLSFDECYALLKDRDFYGISRDVTLFRNRPQITVSYWPDDKWYTRFNTISYKTVYKEASWMSLNDILKKFPAEKCIQYLKERGLAVCPMNI